jgi:AcrR family transcriptional regulator
LKKLTRGQTRIHQTFLKLMAQKGFHKTHVGEILRKADVSRSSFYAHYEDKDHLRTTSENRFLDQMAEAFLKVRQSSSGVPLTNSVLNAADYYALYYECLEENEDLVRLLMSEKNDNHFLPRFIRFVQEQQEITRELWGARKTIPEKFLDYYTASLSWAYVGTFITWINTDKKLRTSPKEMGGVSSFYFG